ncbi:MAG: glycosyltransferase, partial [Ktedonobacteraceae bacterium]
MKTLIIIPTYNEYDNLRPLLEQVFTYAPASDIVIVDDNSPDGTGKLADEMHTANQQVHVMHRTG